jgi:hypothetical protein
MDIATQSKDEEALEKSLVYPSYPDYNNPKADFKAYYTLKTHIIKKYSDGNVIQIKT